MQSLRWKDPVGIVLLVLLQTCHTMHSDLELLGKHDEVARLVKVLKRDLIENTFDPSREFGQDRERASPSV